MTQSSLPFEHFTDLTNLSEAGQEIALAPDEAARSAIAHWAELEALPGFKAQIRIKRVSPNRFAYQAEFEAEVVQLCVVTMEPVTSRLRGNFSRDLHLIRATRQKQLPELAELALGVGEDEAPEEIESPHFDLAGPVLEEFSLSLDPYPRKQGANFVVPEEEKPVSPFAVLRQLKPDA